MDKTRVIMFFVFLGIFVGMYQLGSMSSVSEEDADAFMSEFEELVTDIDGFGIFLHNVNIALVMFVPGLGLVWGVFSAWVTGFAFASLVVAAPQLSDINPLTVFLTPFGLMELTAYSIGLSRSFILIRGIIGKQNLIPFIKPTLIEIGVVVGLLLAGGYIEFFIIEMGQESGLFDMPEV